MATITLTRGSKGANILRKFKVFIDDEYVGKIKRNGTLHFDVPEGLHKVYCRIDWEGSNVLEVEVPGEGIQLEVNSKGFIGSFYALLNVFDGFDKYLVLEQKQ